MASLSCGRWAARRRRLSWHHPNQHRFALNNQTVTSAAGDGATTELATVAVQAADVAPTTVSAGNLALVSERSVALTVAGIVETIDVKVGDSVKAGDPWST